MNLHGKTIYWIAIALILNTGVSFIMGLTWVEASGVTALGMVAGTLADVYGKPAKQGKEQ